jgi:hypothetical protein
LSWVEGYDVGIDVTVGREGSCEAVAVMGARVATGAQRRGSGAKGSCCGRFSKLLSIGGWMCVKGTKAEAVLQRKEVRRRAFIVATGDMMAK